MEERRRHTRYKLDGECIINHSTTVGNILDISTGGFSCMCMDHGECREGLATTINIYCSNYDIRAEDLQTEILSTGIVRGQFIESLGLRKCRGRFIQLDDSQKTQVKHLISASAR